MGLDGFQWILTIAVFPAIGGLFWMIKGFCSDLNSFQVHVAEEYSNKDDNKEMEERINARLDRVENKLNGHGRK